MSGPWTKTRPSRCFKCDRRGQRPRRLNRTGGVVVGECWCGGTMQRVIEPIAGNAFAGQSLVHTLMGIKDPAPITPKDWTPRKGAP